MSVVASRRSFPAWLPPVLLIGAIILAAIIIIALARRASAPDVPPEPDAFLAPEAARPIVALDVQQVAAGKLTLSDGSGNQSLQSDVRVEAIMPATAGDVRAGDWLAVVGIPNEVRNFSIRSLVLIENAAPPDAEGVVRSAGGFAGHEASRDQAERPLLGGRVTGVDGPRITLDGPTGPLTVDLTDRAPLFRITPSSADQIREGDRIAFSAGAIADAASVLLLPGGAR